LIDGAGLARVLEVQARDGGSLGRIAASMGLASEEAVARAIAETLGLEFIDPASSHLPPAPDAALPLDFCRKRRILPLAVAGPTLRLAMADPLDHATLQDVEFRTGKWVRPSVAAETEILKALDSMPSGKSEELTSYDLLTEVQALGDLESAVEEEEIKAADAARLERDVKLPPVIRLVNMVLSEAARAGASDIHLEPREADLLVRQRLDGMLVDTLTIPRRLQPQVVSRLKILSGMDIAERRLPQDGRSRLRTSSGHIDLRISTLPTQFGEKVVVRLLDTAIERVELEKMGFAPENLRQIKGLLTRPQGMILVTGPTGSGKTSTLYAALGALRSPSRNIITVEDPIEYQVPGVNQVQVNTKAGVTFAAGLRSILRQDPNVVLVGEIRDRETAGIALEASMTGHLILSTLHTNDAPSTITRLADLGVEPFVIAASVIAVLAQRLVRRPCDQCATERAPAPEMLERFGGGAALPPQAIWRAGTGCPACRHTGYRGRTAVHELLVVTDEIRDGIARRAPEHELREVARRAGMRTLMEDGIDKASRGLTTLEELARVAPPQESRAPATPPAPPRQRETVQAQSAPQTAPAIPAPGVTGGAAARVLVVEDSPTVVTVVKYFLELEGFEVLVAEDGAAGLEIARREAPDVVVSDLNMPGMDGIALIQALRQEPATRQSAILVLTSETSVESETQGLASGADDYLSKPVEPRRLAARVKAVLERARQRRLAPA
jgi:type IV pilus assembly protein PilB